MDAKAAKICMNIEEFIKKYCNDKCNAEHCLVNFDGSCALSRKMEIEIIGAKGD